MAYPQGAAYPQQNFQQATAYPPQQQPQYAPQAAPPLNYYDPDAAYRARLQQLEANRQAAWAQYQQALQGTAAPYAQPNAAPQAAPQSAPYIVVGINNEDEAKKHTVDINGALQIFVLKDDNEGVIFTKRLDMSTGGIDYRRYYCEKTDTPANATTTPKGDALGGGILEVVGGVTTKLDNIQNDIAALREELKTAQNGNKKTEAKKPTPATPAAPDNTIFTASDASNP